MTSLKSFPTAKAEPLFLKEIVKMEPTFINAWYVRWGYHWEPDGFPPPLSLTLLFPSPSVQWPNSALALWCIEQHVHTSAHTHVFCLRTKSIRHSSKKIKAILIIPAAFVHAHTHTMQKRRQSKGAVALCFCSASKETECENDWVCVREIALRERKSTLSSLVYACVWVCMCVCVRVIYQV